MLTLARQQKVDLSKISILALADQYLAFIDAARKMRLELAADYLVMAAWLAYLKSRLLLPEQHAPDGVSAEDLANALAQRLRRLEGIRQVADQLLNRPQLGRDVFARGQPEPIAEITKPEWTATLYDLLSAYASRRQTKARSFVRVRKRTVWSLAEAREALETADRAVLGLEPARPISRRLSGRAGDGTDCSRVDFCGGAGIGPRGPPRSPSARLVHAALPAQEAGQGQRSWPATARPMMTGGVADVSLRNPGMRKRETKFDGECRGDACDRGRQADHAESVAVSAEELRILEALLFAAEAPLDEKILATRLPAGADVKALLAQLQHDYASRGVNLVRVGGKWTMRTASDLAWLLTHESVVTRKLSRAAIETLAIVAYHQPVTRAEVEEIRGVSTSKGTLDVLLETGWIRLRGRRKAPGRPVTYGTNEAFLSHFGLEALTDLPGLDELKGAGIVDATLPAEFSVPVPSDDPALRDDEDPLEPGDFDLGLVPRAERSEHRGIKRHFGNQLPGNAVA